MGEREGREEGKEGGREGERKGEGGRKEEGREGGEGKKSRKKESQMVVLWSMANWRGLPFLFALLEHVLFS